MRSGAESISSSSSSSSYLDISRTFPPNRFGLRTFFTAPSERRRLRKQRSNRLLKINNSSSSSINSDLAYGTGFIKVSKKRGVRSRNGKEIDRERDSARESGREREYGRQGSGRRATTDAEILAVGAGLAKLARDQNRSDLKSARNDKRAAVVAVKEFSGRQDSGVNRGVGLSKISHGSDTMDEDGWESASDVESESSVDSRLAFGDDKTTGWFGWGGTKNKSQFRKSSIVDPRLFGPANSLHGIVTEPVGFGEISFDSSNDFGQRSSFPTGSTVGGSQSSLQHVYPVPTSDPSRFEAARSSVISNAEPYVSSKPGPIPLQQPQPITPVSQSVFEPTYPTFSESEVLRKGSSGRSKSLAEAALVGVAGAAVGAAIASGREDRIDRRRDDDRDDLFVKRRDGERKDDRRREKRGSPERRERRRERERQKDSSSDPRRDKKREKRHDEPRDDDRDERRFSRREERRSDGSNDRYDDRRTKSDASEHKTPVDPFQYQVDDDAFATPIVGSPAARSLSHRRVESVPTVVTVEREPNFTRTRSSSIKEPNVASGSESRRDYTQKEDNGEDFRKRESRDRTFHDAESIYQETEHSTAPIEIAAIGAAVAAVTAEGYRESRSGRRRNERRGDYEDRDGESRDEESSRRSRRESNPKRDPIQDEADRAYREIVMARKIASQVIRSRTPSPNRSVVDKYDGEEEEEIIRIVTPPGMEDQKKQGLYDAPNADFTLDHVLENPKDLRAFTIPSIDLDHSNSASQLKLDPDATMPRPFLNLVRPTPTPSPAPEKQERQAARSTSTNTSSPTEKTPISASDVVIDSKGNVISSPTSSSVSKGVTWGENETKHYDVESPDEHREEFISSPEVRAADNPAEQPKPSRGSKRSGWGAIVAGITGAGIGAAAVSKGESSSTSSKSTEKESKPDGHSREASFEHRGVVVEPEDFRPAQRRRSPPTASPSMSTTQSSHIPGAFDEDLDFTATVAAGLQDTGFDPDIVINDPSFRRRDSPPSYIEPSVYQKPFAETVSDLGTITDVAPEQGFIMGEVPETPNDWRSVSPDNNDTQTKLSKKEQKKREKAARRQSGDATTFESSTVIAQGSDADFETPKSSRKDQKARDKAFQEHDGQNDELRHCDVPSLAEQIVEEPESYFETPKKSKTKKSKRGTFSLDVDNSDGAAEDTRKVSVPVDAFEDLRNGEDEWSEAKKSKKKSKRGSERYDSPSRAVPPEAASELERSSSKKSKDKSRRKSEQYAPDPTEVSLPASTPSELSRDGDVEEPRRSRRSISGDSEDRGESRSVVSADGSRSGESRKSKKKSRSGTKGDFDDTRSVASAPAGEDFEDSKKIKKKDKRNSGSFFGLFGSKSEIAPTEESPRGSKDEFEEPRKKTKKSKRNSTADESSLYGDMGSQSINVLSRTSSNGNGQSNGSHRYEDQHNGSQSDEEKKKTSLEPENPSPKNDSFLAKAGILGAGAGLAGVAVAIAAQHHQHSKADQVDSKETLELSRLESQELSKNQRETFDLEITERRFRPSIDPQYGDLLPLPPSDPVSPNVEPTDSLPTLPESRPDTPEAERLSRDRAPSSIRKNLQENPTKSPSQSAVPLKFILGNRSTPSSPGAVRSSPQQSPATPNQESLVFPRNRPRPTSWDSTKEYKPLYLVESNRRESIAQQIEPEEALPALPPSQRTSRSSSEIGVDDTAQEQNTRDPQSRAKERAADSLSIDTTLPSRLPVDLLDSQQSTPKAIMMTDNIEPSRDLPQEHDSIDISPNPTLQNTLSPQPGDRANSMEHENPEAGISQAVLASAIGYFASSPGYRVTSESWLKGLPPTSPVHGQPSLVDPTTNETSPSLFGSFPEPRTVDDGYPFKRHYDSAAARSSSFYADGDPLRGIEEQNGSDISPRIDDQLLANQESEDISDFPPGHLNIPDARPASEPVDVDDTDQVVPDNELESATTSATNDTKTADEFVVTRSKKDKKTDKNRGKVSSRSSTFDAAFLPDAGEEIQQDDASRVEPADEFPSVISQKDKKKNKKKGKTMIASEHQQEEVIPEPPQELSQETSKNLARDVAIPGDISSPEARKRKKKDKKNRPSALFEPEGTDTISPSATQSQYSEVDQETLPRELDAESKIYRQSEKIKEKATSTLFEPVTDTKPQQLQPSTNTGIPEDEQPSSKEFIASEIHEKKENPEVPGAAKSDPYVNAPKAPESKLEDDFVVTRSKKDKKKGKKSQSRRAVDILASEATLSRDLASDEVDANRDVSDVEFSEEVAQDSFKQDNLSSTKKNNKKSVESQSRGLESQLPQPFGNGATEPGTNEPREIDALLKPVASVTEDYATSASNEAAEPSQTQKATNVQEDAGSRAKPEITGASSDHANILSAESPASRPTPMGGPGAWPVTPGTPWTEADEGPSKPSVAGYFPSAASLHSPRTIQGPEDSSSKGYFPSAPALSPFALGAAFAGTDHLNNRSSSRDGTPVSSSEDLTSKNLEMDGNQPQLPDTILRQPAPDGSNAGSDQDQLNVARESQEEFSIGSKRLKMDKKKRRSLPSTPQREYSRSRAPSEATESQPRARSLSIGPPAFAEPAEGYLVTERRVKDSEDESELSHQMKAEIESGNNNEKEDNEKKQRSSGVSVYDDEALNISAGAPVPLVAEPAPDLGGSTEADGFQVGYQEDQLSFARQLQAEFGPSSKGSQKDKKRRSASPTPIEESESRVNHYEESSQPSPEESVPVNVAPEREISCGGLNVESSMDQPSLNTQLQQEFDSGSTTSGKAKKDAKRKSLNLSAVDEIPDNTQLSVVTEGEADTNAFDADAVKGENSKPIKMHAGDVLTSVTGKHKKGKKGEKLERASVEMDDQAPLPESKSRDVGKGTRQTVDFNADSPPWSTAEIGISEAVKDPEEVFAFVSKKAKKSKIDKTLETLTSEMDGEERLPESNIKGQNVESNSETWPEGIQGGFDEPFPANPDPRFSSKKSKKDKKGKNRDRLSNDTTQRDASDQPLGDSAESFRNAPDQQSLKIRNELPSQDYNDETSFTTKKSKKDKKKRRNVALEDPSVDQPEPSSEYTQLIAPAPLISVGTEVVEEDPNDIGLLPGVSKEQSNDTKTLFDENPRKADENLQFEQPTKTSGEADEGWSSPQTFIPEKAAEVTDQIGTKTHADNTRTNASETGLYSSGSTNLDVSILDDETKASEGATDTPDNLFEDFAFTNKRSKKDKKKRKSSSKVDSDEPSGVSASVDPASERLNSSGRSIPTEALFKSTEKEVTPLFETVREPLPINTPGDEAGEKSGDEWGSFIKKKSKKDKKKRKSGLSTPTESKLENYVGMEEKNKSEILSSTHDRIAASGIPQKSSREPVLTSEIVVDASEFNPTNSKEEETKLGGSLTTPIEDSSTNEPLGYALPADEAQEPDPRADENKLDLFIKEKERGREEEQASRSEAELGLRDKPLDLVPLNAQAEEHFLTTSEQPRQDDGAPETLATMEQMPEFEPLPDLGSSTRSPERTLDQLEKHTYDSSGLDRQTSNKDKRKRQSTVESSINDESESTKQPLTTWADEVEEAEVSRELPVIEEIAEDKSLSHIASSIGSSPVDFFRPTKKGKKGKKKTTGSLESTINDDSIPAPGVIDSAKRASAGGQTSVSTIAEAAGAALAGASLLTAKPEEPFQGTAGDTSSKQVPKTEDSASVSPRKKPSKKERHKVSTTRRPGSEDDIFDDPSIWESAEPTELQEREFHENKDGGVGSGDGSWSPPDDTMESDNTVTFKGGTDTDIQLSLGHAANLPPLISKPDNIQSPRNEAPSIQQDVFPLSLHEDKDAIDVAPVHDPSKPEKKLDDVLDESTVSSSKSYTRVDGQSLLSGRIVAQVEKSDPLFSASTSTSALKLPENRSEQCHVQESINFEEAYVASPERLATPSRHSDNERGIEDRVISSQELQMNSEPITPLAAYKYVRPTSSSLPAVQEESNAQIESEQSQYQSSHYHDIGEINRDSAFVTGSPIPRQRGFTDDHEHVRDSGVHLRDFSPSEKPRAAVSSTDDAIASMTWPVIAENKEKIDLHSSHQPWEDPNAIHPSEVHCEEDLLKQDRRMDVAPGPQRDEERRNAPHLGEWTGSRETHEEAKTTDLHRTKTIRRSPKAREDGVVKQRVQRIESPEANGSQKASSDRYGEAAGAAVAATAIGFAAARQASQDQRPGSAQSQRSLSNINRLRTPDPRERGSSGTPPLRRSDGKSGDLRSLSQRSKPDLAKEAELAAATPTPTASTITANPTANEGRVRAKDMADVYVSCFTVCVSASLLACRANVFSRMASAKAAWVHPDLPPDPTACAAVKACRSSISNPDSIS
jgi:hypothetical protein